MTSSPVSGLSQEEYEYIAAVIEDRNYEFTIGGDYSLFTDWEGDGKFFPSVTILHLVESNEDIDASEEIRKISEFLSDYTWFKYDEASDFQDDTASGISHLYFYNPRIDENVLEDVEDTL